MPTKPAITFDDYGATEVVNGTTAHSFPMHIHKSDCHIEITMGMALLYCGKVTLLHKGDCEKIPGGVPHKITAVDGAAYSYRTICIKPTGSVSEGLGFLETAKRYIATTPMETFEIRKMASALHYSEYHLIHKFKKLCGISPYQYFLNIRIEKIRQGLLREQPLSDLAHCLGFSHQSHLCNVFKQYMGLTPTQYRAGYVLHTSEGVNVAKI